MRDRITLPEVSSEDGGDLYEAVGLQALDGHANADVVR
jgi:hypothetical protein